MQECCISVSPIVLNIHIILGTIKGCKNGVISVPFYIYLFSLISITRDTKLPQEVLPLSSYALDEQKFSFGEDILS